MLKRKIITIMGCMGMAMMAMSNAVAVEIQIKPKIDMSAPENEKFSNIFKNYDLNNVPPTVNELTKQVGKQDELTVFVPNEQVDYFFYFRSSHPTAVEYRKKFFYELFNDDDTKPRNEYTSLGIVKASLIKKMDFYNNGVLMTLNVKDSPLTEFEVNEDKYSVTYSYAYGYVLKATLRTKTQKFYVSLDPVDVNAINYILNEYVKAIKNKGYTNKNLLGWLIGERLYEKDNIVIEIADDLKDEDNRYSKIQSSVAKMTVYNKEVYDNFKKIQDEIKTRNYEEEYKKLNFILK